MSEFKKLFKMQINAFQIIQYPNKRFGYVGKVPVDIGYIDPTPEKIAAGARCGARFGPKTRSFETAEAALKFARDNGFEPGETL